MARFNKSATGKHDDRSRGQHGETVAQVAEEVVGSPASSTNSGPVTCLVADDHPAIVEAVSQFLEAHRIEVVARARDGRQALAEINARHPRIALLDIRMPGLSGTEVARRVAYANPPTGVILYTGRAERALVVEALDAGARGFLLKEAPLADLIRAVEMVAAGALYVDPALAGQLANAAADDPALTAREREVLRLLSEGLPNGEVGRRLFISPETVRTHMRKAMRKLDATTRTQAVAEAIRRSLIT